ncbi:MAG: hypothetical protein ACK6DS_04490 [Planctomycetota bacterium]|jgi:hypothetical protein
METFGDKHMAGLHFYCGKWLGEDKSANPIFDVIDDVREFVSSGADDQSIEDFFREWDAQLENDKIKLTETMLSALYNPLMRYQDDLVCRLGLSSSEASIEELGAFPRSISDDESKFLCVIDIFKGFEVVKKTGNPLVIHFC